MNNLGEKKEKHKDCPIVEIPEHGDLIDRDAHLSNVRKSSPRWMWYREILETLEQMPVVIPAERSEE